MPPDEPNTISLKAGDQLAIKPSGAEGEFQVYLTRGGEDKGPVNGANGSPITLSADTPTLTLTGNGTGSTITTPDINGQTKGVFIPRLSIQTDNSVMVDGAFISANDSTQKARVGTTAIEAANLNIAKSKDGNSIILSTDKDTLKANPEKNKGLSKLAIFLKYMDDEERTVAGVEKGSAGIQFVNTEDRQKNLFLLDGSGSLSKNRSSYKGFVEDIKDQVGQAFQRGDKKEQDRLGVPDRIPVEEKGPRGRASTRIDVAAVQRQQLRGQGRKLGDDFQSLVNTFERNKGKFSSVPEFEKTLRDAKNIATGISQKGVASSKDADALVEKMDSLYEQADELAKNDFNMGMTVRQKLDSIKRSEGYQAIAGGAEQRKEEKEKEEGKEQASTERPVSSMSAAQLAQARAAVDPSIAGQSAVAASRGENQVAAATETVVSGNNRTV